MEAVVSITMWDKSLGKGQHGGWNSRLCSCCLCVRYVFFESSCLGIQLKVGGKFHLKLNIGARPIANKYREGKMKRTLKRELNSTWNCWKGTVLCKCLTLCIFHWRWKHCWCPVCKDDVKVSWYCGRRVEWRLSACRCYISLSRSCGKDWGTNNMLWSPTLSLLFND